MDQETPEVKAGLVGEVGGAAEEQETPADDQEENGEEEIHVEIKIPTDDRTIWSIERFFLFSLVMTFFKIIVAIYSTTLSVQAIAVDAVLDLIVSGLGIYLIQWQQKIFQKVHKGTQEVKVNEKGALTIALVQGLILFIGGLVIFFPAVFSLQWLSYYTWYDNPPASIFPLLPALLLALIIPAKFYMFSKQREDCIACENNIALKSIEVNLMFDLVVNISAWFILILTTFWYWPFVILDYVVTIFIALWMMWAGVKYLRPFIAYIKAYDQKLKREQKKKEEEEKGKENESKDEDAFVGEVENEVEGEKMGKVKGEVQKKRPKTQD